MRDIVLFNLLMSIGDAIIVTINNSSDLHRLFVDLLVKKTTPSDAIPQTGVIPIFPRKRSAVGLKLHIKYFHKNCD